jgi:hypothetical protein
MYRGQTRSPGQAAKQAVAVSPRIVQDLEEWRKRFREAIRFRGEREDGKRRYFRVREDADAFVDGRGRVVTVYPWTSAKDEVLAKLAEDPNALD